MVCKQFSFSNAEIFSHAVKTLKRGKVVGVQAAGRVISAFYKEVLHHGRMRLPFRGWYALSDGEYMEMKSAMPDIVLWPHPGELESGIDRQLQKAVEVLKKGIAESMLEDIKIHKVSERK